MRSPTTLLLLAATLAHARITALGVPQTIAPGSTLALIVRGTSYIQSVTDVSLAAGYSPGAAAPLGDGLGIFVQAFDLGAFSCVCVCVCHFSLG